MFSRYTEVKETLPQAFSKCNIYSIIRLIKKTVAATLQVKRASPRLAYVLADLGPELEQYACDHQTCPLEETLAVQN